MDLLPAIDIRSGRVVRLSQGESTRQTVYGNDPAATAELLIEQGARWIHVVDLDRAFGAGSNLEVIGGLIQRVGPRARVQLGGGLRTLDLAREGIDLGASRIVIGTAAALDSAFVPGALAALGPERLAVGIDAREGRVALRGWTETSARMADDLAREIIGYGIQTLVYTDIERDGMLRGPDLSGALSVQALGARVIVSGGVTGTSDIRAACLAGLAGVIVGRALYEGRFGLREGLQAANCSPAR